MWLGKFENQSDYSWKQTNWVIAIGIFSSDDLLTTLTLLSGQYCDHEYIKQTSKNSGKMWIG